MRTLKPTEEERKTGKGVTWWGGQAMAFTAYLNRPLTHDDIVRARWIYGVEFAHYVFALVPFAVGFLNLSLRAIESTDLIVIGLILCSATILRLWQGRLDLSSKADLPSTAPQFSARIRVKYAGMTVCRDVGMVTFMEGYLMFEGNQTEFGIRSQDCGATPVSTNVSFGIKAKVEGGIPLEIFFIPVENLSSGKKKRNPMSISGATAWLFRPTLEMESRTGFGESWLEWRQSQELQISNSTYPPIELAPDRLLIAKRVRASIVFGLFVGVLSIPCINGFLCLSATVASLIGFVALTISYKAHRDYLAATARRSKTLNQ